mmetsp:Transcript_70900/g.140652  ORF Transcript_70900/g.140652 Transcript_70900/m.140652 type:complete len:140 (+) Transcript_70900:655-1074(+)
MTAPTSIITTHLYFEHVFEADFEVIVINFNPRSVKRNLMQDGAQKAPNETYKQRLHPSLDCSKIDDDAALEEPIIDAFPEQLSLCNCHTNPRTEQRKAKDVRFRTLAEPDMLTALTPSLFHRMPLEMPPEKCQRKSLHQ